MVEAFNARGLLVMLGLALLTTAVLGGAMGCDVSEQDGGDAEDPQASDPVAPKTEIVVQGQNATVRIDPSDDDVISGIVTITITEAPEATELGFFAIRRQGAEDLWEDGPNIGIDTDGSDGWSSLLDTAEFENGVYEVSGLAMADADSDPLGLATAQVVIEN